MAIDKETKLLLEGYIDQIKSQKTTIEDVVNEMKSMKVSITAKDIEALMKQQPQPKTDEKVEDVSLTIKDLHNEITKQRKQNENVNVFFKDMVEKELEGNQELVGLMMDGNLSEGESNIIQETLMKDVINKLEGMGFEEDVVQGNMEMFENSMIGVFEDALKNSTSSMGIMQKSITKFFDTKAGQHIQQGYESLKDTVKGHVSDILGDVKTLLIDPVMNLGKSVWGFMTTNKDDIQIGLLEGISSTLDKQLGLSKKQDLAGKRVSKDKDGGLFGGMGAIGIGLLLLGAAIGGIVKSLVLPFQVLASMTKTLKPIMGIMSSIGNFIKPFITTITTMGKSSAMLMKAVNFLQPLFKGLSLGFRVLGWPLQILLSAIDFFQGFIGSEETTFMGKLKDGVKRMFTDFFDMPLKVLGWIADKALGLFGAEIEGGVGNMLIEGLNKLLDVLLSPIEMLKSIVDYEMNLISGVYNDVLTGFSGFFNSIKELPTAIWSGLSQKFSGVPLIGKFFEKNKPEAAKVTTGANNIIQNAVVPNNLSTINNEMQQVKAEQEVKKIQSQKDMVKAINDTNSSMVNNSNAQTSSMANLMSAMTVNNTTNNVNTNEPPDDIEQIALLLMNKSWGI